MIKLRVCERWFRFRFLPQALHHAFHDERFASCISRRSSLQRSAFYIGQSATPRR